jgi:hypothetical protein
VFTPDPYGDWQAHPFQYLRNDPGFDGPVLYATTGPPARNVRVLRATNRTPYRFTYRGEWVPAARPVTPELTRLRVLRGDRVRATTTVGVPQGATSASVRVETTHGHARYAAAPTGETLSVRWTVGRTARVESLPRAAGPDAVPVPRGASTVTLLVTFVDASGGSVTYRQELTVDRDGGTVTAVWPPPTRVCRLTTDCGREGTWVGPDGDYLTGVSVDATARATNATA